MLQKRTIFVVILVIVMALPVTLALAQDGPPPLPGEVII